MRSEVMLGQHMAEGLSKAFHLMLAHLCCHCVYIYIALHIIFLAVRTLLIVLLYLPHWLIVLLDSLHSSGQIRRQYRLLCFSKSGLHCRCVQHFQLLMQPDVTHVLSPAISGNIHLEGCFCLCSQL